MSMLRVAAVVQLEGLKCSQFAVLTVLADCENDKTGQCNPSYAYISRKLHMTERQVGTVIRGLVSQGLITRRRTSTSSQFGFCFDKLGSKTVSSRESDAKESDIELAFDECEDLEECFDGDMADGGDLSKTSYLTCRKFPVSDLSKTSYKPGIYINQEYNQEKNLNNTSSCSCYNNIARSVRVCEPAVGKQEQEQGSFCGCGSNDTMTMDDKAYVPHCEDLPLEAANKLTYYDVVNGVGQRYGIRRYNRAVIEKRLHELRENGWHAKTGKPIGYVWPYLFTMVKGIKDDENDLAEHLHHEEVARLMALYENV